MKRTILIIFICFGFQHLVAQNRYSRQWNTIEKLELKGKYKTASDKVDKIFNKATRLNESQQIVKSLIYKSKFSLLLNENAQQKIITELEAYIESADFPTNAILASVYADFLQQYYNNNKYRIRQRTRLPFSHQSNDFEKWDIDYFVCKIALLFDSSIKDNRLKQLPIDDFKEFLTISRTSSKYRTTLYDFLAHRAIDFYEKEKRFAERPKDRFYINDSVVFASTEKFVQEDFLTPDSLYSNRNVLKIYQKLESFNKSHDTIAYVDVFLERLNFSRKNCILENRDSLYLKALNRTSLKYEKREVSAVIDYHIANFYYEASRRYQAKIDPVLKNYRINAIDICKKVLRNFPNSDGGLLCKVLKNKIEEENLSITTERYVIPNKPFLGRIKFKSIDSIYILTYKIPHDLIEIKHHNLRDSIALKIIKENQPTVSAVHKLQPINDYYQYSTEVILPQLTIGKYFIVASKVKKITSLNQILGYDMITSTNLAMLRIEQDKNLILRILDRDNGNPIQNANISVSGDEGYKLKGSTNSLGEFSIPKGSAYQRDVRIAASKRGDTIFSNNYYIDTYENQDEDDGHRVKMALMLDRSIYRPGQTIYFKGLVFEQKNGISSVLPNKFVSVIINDANYDEIKEFRLKTNEFGSISGEYKLPTSILTGEFSIEMDEDYGDDENEEDPFWDDIEDVEYSEIEFSVEEYKRPKFEVVFDDVTNNYKIGDSIFLSGKAKAFLGSNVSNAKVRYNITRVVNTSLYGNYYGGNQVISTGETQTNDKGEFLVKFISVPDSLIAKKYKPIFTYSIKSDVTDINGETQSGEKSVFIGYHNLSLEMVVSDKLNSDQDHVILINCENLNGQPTSAVVEIDIYKLIEPNRILRKKPWDLVDLQSIAKETYINLFPNEVYDSLDLKKYWLKGDKVYSKKFSSSSTNTITLDDLSYWYPGDYKIEVKGVDSLNDTISINKRIEVVNTNSEAISKNKLFEFKVLNSQYKKDKRATIKLTSPINDLKVYVEVYQKDEEVFKEIVTIKNYDAIINIPIYEYYKDRLDVHLSFVQFNELHTSQLALNFEESENKLNIETMSFRNRLIPDQNETWSFKIINSDGDNAQAEVLASMYDSSLDKFNVHYWRTDLGFRSYYYPYSKTVKGDGFFSTTQFDGFYNSTNNSTITALKNYHQLRLFGFNFTNSDYTNQRYFEVLKMNMNYPRKQIEGNISGIITDNTGLPLPGVNVVVKDTSIGTQTDFDGYYTINASEGSELVYSYVGFKTNDILVGKYASINVAMEEDAAQLEEVVITASGIKKEKKSLGYAVTNFNNELDIQSYITSRLQGKVAGVDIVAANGLAGSSDKVIIRGMSSFSGNKQTLFIIDGVPISFSENTDGINLSPLDIDSIDVLKGAAATSLYGSEGANGVVIITTKKSIKELSQVETRDDLKETAFFYPHLTTNNEGEVIFNFKSPQALTKWKFMLLAHSKKLEIGALEKTAYTQKDLNVIPNTPRFLRENDTIIISSKVVNLTTETLSGNSILQLYDALTMEPVDKELMNLDATKSFIISPKGNVAVSWKLFIPIGLQTLKYKILAKSGAYTDGESNVLPILSNRTLVTEAKPLWVASGKTQSIEFEKLKNNKSQSLKNHRFTLEYTSNPAWLAIKSLPYLMEFPHECAEQTFARFYSNTLADNLINSNPKIRDVFDAWQSGSSAPSDLEKNEKLKSILLSESPWARDLMTDEEIKMRLANLFNKEKVKEQQLLTLNKLNELQLSTGAFPWFSGGKESHFITRHILAGFGHLKKLEIDGEFDYKSTSMIRKSINYLDSEFIKEYDNTIRKLKDSSKVVLNHRITHYLYARSFYLDEYPIENGLKSIIDIYIKKSKKDWLSQPLYNKGMIALFLHRIGDKKVAQNIIDALYEQSVQSDEDGMYWKENSSSWNWYNAAVETQALLIESFSELGRDDEIIDKMKLWLLKNKRTSQWSTTKATTEAVYALLINGGEWLSVSENTIVRVGEDKIKTSKLKNTEKEAGSGYFKINWNEKEITPEMASVTVTNKSDVVGYGGVYWQYFEDLDTITSSGEKPMHIKKSLYLKKSSSTGKVLEPIEKDTKVRLGDVVTVRIEITSNNDMEFVHMKDLRSSGLEPIDVFSEYKWQDGLGYYQSTKDVATHFFFDSLPSGTYVFEYDLRANNSGDFSNGITTIQSMYAPEFIDHSNGIRVTIQE
jgi:TonB-dependent SusC/RagA subfamily outer membrane receptor